MDVSMYRDLTQLWRIIGKKYAFKLLTGFRMADNIIDLCFILNNLYNTLNHNECSQWFELAPPTCEVYLSQGCRAAFDHEEREE